MSSTKKVKELGMLDLANWVIDAPVGEARAAAFRADGNDMVTVKQFVNSAIVQTTDMTPGEFRKFTGVAKRRADGTEN